MDEETLTLAEVSDFLMVGERTNILRVRRQVVYRVVQDHPGGYSASHGEGHPVDTLQQLVQLSPNRFVWRDVPIVETL